MMPKTTPRLRMGEDYDKQTLEHLNKAIEFKEQAVNSTVPADRERYGREVTLQRVRGRRLVGWTN
jgi:hypothetical protein